MRTEEQIKQAMRAAANGIEPPVSDLVAGGLAKGRKQRRRRMAAIAGGIATASAVVAGGAVALPDLLASPPDVVAYDRAADQARDDVQAAPEVAEEQPPLVIEDPAAAVSEDQMQALLGDVAALADGTVESAGLLNPPVAQIRLDFGDLGIGEVSAHTIDETMVSEDGWCRGGSHPCEVLLDTETAMLGHEETPYGDRLWYVAKIGGERYGRQQHLHVRADTDDVPDGTTVADLGFDNYHAFREAIVTAVPDSEQRGEFAADELNDIAVAVARLSSASSGEFVSPYDTTVTGRVLLDGADAFDVSVSFDRTGNDLSVWTESCGRGASDGKPCTELMNTGEIGVFASTYPNQSGREKLLYAADLTDGTLIVGIDNYMETSSGKVVGASLSDAGMDPDELVAVVVSSGLLD